MPINVKVAFLNTLPMPFKELINNENTAYVQITTLVSWHFTYIFTYFDTLKLYETESTQQIVMENIKCVI